MMETTVEQVAAVAVIVMNHSARYYILCGSDIKMKVFLQTKIVNSKSTVRKQQGQQEVVKEEAFMESIIEDVHVSDVHDMEKDKDIG